MVAAAHLLGQVLRQGVPSAGRAGGLILLDQLAPRLVDLMAPVLRVGAGLDEVADPLMVPCGFQHVEGALDVDVQVLLLREGTSTLERPPPCGRSASTPSVALRASSSSVMVPYSSSTSRLCSLAVRSSLSHTNPRTSCPASTKLNSQVRAHPARNPRYQDTHPTLLQRLSTHYIGRSRAVQ